jgi:hypothetical protein
LPACLQVRRLILLVLVVLLVLEAESLLRVLLREGCGLLCCLCLRRRSFTSGIRADRGACKSSSGSSCNNGSS